MIHAWEEETHALYGMGLLMLHCFCDSKGVLERERAPEKQSLLSAFMVHMATAYSGKTIVNYLSAVCVAPTAQHPMGTGKEGDGDHVTSSRKTHPRILKKEEVPSVHPLCYALTRRLSQLEVS